MAIPFKVFEPDYSDFFPKYVWCVRCEDWIPIKEAYGSAYDPHIRDHVCVYYTLKAVELAAVEDVVGIPV